MIGIDPGKNGGIVYDTPNGRLVMVKMPETMGGLLEELRNAKSLGNNTAVMEKVGQHMAGNNASASAKFARHCGHLEMALLSVGLIQYQVTPQKWMKWLGVLPKDKRERKHAIKGKMEMLFPQYKLALWNSDALALYQYGRENHA